MDKLNLTESLTNYPLTIEGIKLLQDAIALASSGVLTGGGDSSKCYIVSGCTAQGPNTSEGTLLIKGELFNFKGGATTTYVQVSSVPEPVTVGQVEYPNARIRRTASFTNQTGSDPYYEWNTFTRIKTNVEIYDLIKNNGIDQLKSAESNYLVPKGAIIMWSGDPKNIPYGWALCDGWYYNPNDSTDKVFGYNSLDPTYKIHTFQTPDLQGRFVVGYSNYPKSNSWGQDYATIGNMGGVETTTDIVDHVHSYMSDDDLINVDHEIYYMRNRYTYHNLDPNHMENTYGYMGYNGDFKSSPNSGERRIYFYSTSQALIGSTLQQKTALDNRPPYYVLAYIMKIH